MPKRKWLKVWDIAEERDEILSLAQKFLEGLEIKNYSLRSLETIKSRLSCFLWWVKEARIEKVRSITLKTMENYQRYLLHLLSEKTAQPLSIRGRNRYLNAACMFLRFLAKNEYILTDFTRRIALPKDCKHSLPETLSYAEVEAILKQPDLTTPLGLRDRAMLETLYSCGLRRSELANLCVMDVDITSGTIFVRQGKGRKQRLIPLGERAALWVAKYLQEGRRNARAEDTQSIVFLSSKGKPISAGEIALRVREYIRAAGITKQGNCHLLRHAMATHMLENGADIRYIQEMLGHEQLESTQIYTKVSIDSLKQVHSQTHPGDLISPQIQEIASSCTCYPKIQREHEVSQPAIADTFWDQPSTTASLKSFAKLFLQFLELKGYSQSTILAHKRRLKFFLSWCMDRNIYLPQELHKAVVVRYQAHLMHLCKGSGLPLSSRYQALIVTTLSLFLKWLEESGHILTSLALFIEMPKLTSQIPAQILSINEVKAVLSKPNIKTTLGLRNRAILETLYSTGIRRKELIGLNVTHISFCEATVRVVDGKGGQERIVPIGQKALEWVERYVEHARPILLQEEEENALFITTGKKRLSTYQANEIVTQAIKRAGIIKKGSCHILRHSMATHMLENGADIRYIQEMLGHKRLNSTQIYTKVSIRRLKEVHSQTHPANLKPSKEKNTTAI